MMEGESTKRGQSVMWWDPVGLGQQLVGVKWPSTPKIDTATRPFLKFIWDIWALNFFFFLFFSSNFTYNKACVLPVTKDEKRQIN